MRGADLSENDLKTFKLYSPHKRINDSSIRVAVDDFTTILKEIKSTLGKK